MRAKSRKVPGAEPWLTSDEMAEFGSVMPILFPGVGWVGLSDGFASRRPRVRIPHAPSPEKFISRTFLDSVSTIGDSGASAVRADRR
jgi:hypothetical protein